MTLTRRELREVAEELGALLEVGADLSWRPRYNVAPTDRHPIVRARETARSLELARWGMGHGAAKADGRALPVLINARAETAASRPSFRDAFVKRRCLVPADGFFEWRNTPEGRQPLWLHPQGGGLLLFAGLYAEAEPGVTEPRFTILTTTPSDDVRAIHDRMPVILGRAEANAWLAAPSQGLLRPAPAGTLVATPVSLRVNSVKNDDPECLAPPVPDTGARRQFSLF